MLKFNFNQTESSERTQSRKGANYDQLVHVSVLIDLGLDALGVITPVASSVSLIKTIVQAFRKKKLTLSDAGTIVLNVLGFVPNISILTSMISLIMDAYKLYKIL